MSQSQINIPESVVKEEQELVFVEHLLCAEY